MGKLVSVYMYLVYGTVFRNTLLVLSNFVIDVNCLELVRLGTRIKF